jgi:hypothetical protein
MSTYTIFERDDEHRIIHLRPFIAKALDYLIGAGRCGITTAEMTPGYRFSAALKKLRDDYNLDIDTQRNAFPNSNLALYILHAEVIKGFFSKAGDAT